MISFKSISAFSLSLTPLLAILLITGCATTSSAPVAITDPHGYHVNHEQTVARGGVGNYVFRGSSAHTAAAPATEKQLTTRQAAPTRPEFNGKTIYFPSNVATLSTVQKSDLKALSQNLKNNSNLKLKIAGFSDPTGSSTKNMKLSQARAKSVASFLKANGIPANRFEISAYGDSRASPDKSSAVTEKERKTTITTN